MTEEIKTELEPKIEPDPEPKIEPEPEPNKQTDCTYSPPWSLEPEPKPEPKPEPEAKTEPEPEPEPNPEIDELKKQLERANIKADLAIAGIDREMIGILIPGLQEMGQDDRIAEIDKIKKRLAPRNQTALHAPIVSKAPTDPGRMIADDLRAFLK